MSFAWAHVGGHVVARHRGELVAGCAIGGAEGGDTAEPYVSPVLRLCGRGDLAPVKE